VNKLLSENYNVCTPAVATFEAIYYI
jgi:hypothetical protein